MPGPESQLNKKLLSKIRACILEGKNIRETANVIGIAEHTFYNWTRDNTLNVSDKIEIWKKDRLIKLASDNLEANLKMNTTNVVRVGEKDEIKTDTGLERIKADMTKFTLETLAKKDYSKRSELTGKDGEAIEMKIEREQAERLAEEIIKNKENEIHKERDTAVSDTEE